MFRKGLQALKGDSLVWRFRLLYALLVTVVAGLTLAVYTRPVPKPSAAKAGVCVGLPGVEKCVREQLTTQGAPDGELTCVEAKIPGHDSYLCDFQADGGAGCYDIVAARSRGGYALLEAVAQRTTC